MSLKYKILLGFAALWMALLFLPWEISIGILCLLIIVGVVWFFILLYKMPNAMWGPDSLADHVKRRRDGKA